MIEWENVSSILETRRMDVKDKLSDGYDDDDGGSSNGKKPTNFS